MMMLTRGATLVLILMIGACGDKPVPQSAPPHAPPQDIVVLLRDPDTDTIGRAVVSSPSGGSVELTKEQESTRVVVGRPPSARIPISDAEVQRLFGDALAARPPAPRRFLLYFVTASEELTPESRLLLPEILAFVKNRPVPDVTFIGHTDTTHTADSNFQLGWRRATMIRDQLIAAGVGAGPISVASHGESDLMVPTPDDTDEPKNRRVEVTVR